MAGRRKGLPSSDFGFCVNVPFSPCGILRWGVNALALLRPTRPDLLIAEHVLATVRPARVVLPVSDEYGRTVGEIQCAPLWNARHFAPLWVRLAVGAVAGQTLRTMPLYVLYACKTEKQKFPQTNAFGATPQVHCREKRSQRPSFIATAKRQTETDGFEKMIRSILFGVDEGLHLPLSHVVTLTKTPCPFALSAAIMNFGKHSSFIFIVKICKGAQTLTRYCYFPLKIAYSEQNRKKIIILATFFENHLYKAVFLWYNVCGIMRRP